MIKKVKVIYENVLELNIQINSLLNDFSASDFDNFNKKLQELLRLKDKSIQELFSIIETSKDEFEKIKKAELKEISEKVDILEKENLKLIQDKKGFLSIEINKANQAAKALSAYKFNKRTEPKIFDETE